MIAAEASDRFARELVTPEGLPLRVRLATKGERVAAFLLDAVLVVLAWIVFGICSGLIGMATTPMIGMSLLALSMFVVQFGYFPFFELRWNGATPGKRVSGIRVVDSRGGGLDFDAVLARNFLRYLELFVPLMLLFAGDSLLPGAGSLVFWASLIWVLGLGLYPFFDGDVRRVGDLVAGTLVVRVPKAELERDVGEARRKRRRRRGNRIETVPEAGRYQFTREQLGHYGIYELQVLEDLLRAPPRDARQVANKVCRTIQRRIDWPEEQRDVDVGAFLRDFYRQQRDELERRMQFGERKEFKTPGKRPRPR